MNKSEFSTISCAISKLCIKTDRLISFTREKRWENREKGCRQKGRNLDESRGFWDGGGRRGGTRVKGGMKGERGGREKKRKEGGPTSKK